MNGLKYENGITVFFKYNLLTINMIQLHSVTQWHSSTPSIFPQEPVVQPSREDSSVFHPQDRTGRGPKLQHHQQTSQTQSREGSTLPQHHEPVSVSHLEGRPIS